MATWHVNDLTAATGAPAAGVPPAAYVFDAQGTQHVLHVGNDDRHMHELWWDTNGWHHNDLTAASGGPAVGQFRLSGYVFDAQGTQHVVYIGVDSHVHELWWNTSGWHHLASRRPTGEIGQGASAPTTAVDLASLLQQRARKACRFFGYSAMKSITPMF